MELETCAFYKNRKIFTYIIKRPEIIKDIKNLKNVEIFLAVIQNAIFKQI